MRRAAPDTRADAWLLFAAAAQCTERIRLGPCVAPIYTREPTYVRLTETYAPAGLNHALVSFADPFTLRAWAGIEVDGRPDLGERVRIMAEQVLPELSSL